MEEKDITANMARDAISRQSNEEEVAAVFRLHMKRFWSQERILLFCLDMLGVNKQDFIAWRGAVEHSVQADVACTCDILSVMGGVMIGYKKDCPNPSHAANAHR